MSHARTLLHCGIALLVAMTIPAAQAQLPASGTQDIRALDAAERIEGNYIVVLKDDVVSSFLSRSGSTDVKAAVESIAQDVKHGYSANIGFTYGYAVRGFSLTGVAEEDARRMAGDPRVAYVEASFRIDLAATTQLSPPWGLDRIDQRYLPLDGYYAYSPGRRIVNAYVVDSGITPHDDFGSRLQPGFTIISDGYGTADCMGHGTHVAGTLGGTTYGVAKEVRLYPVRVFGCSNSTSNENVAAGLEWIAENGILPAVVNLSLGSPMASTLVEDAVSSLLLARFVVVAAAGNAGWDACGFSPARMDATSALISVANSTQSDARSPESNWGRCVTLFAPGTDILSAGIAGPGSSSIKSGTSMSTPHVAGAVARLIANERMTPFPQAAKDNLISSSTRGVIANTGSSPNRLLNVPIGASEEVDVPLTPVPPAPTNLEAFCLTGQSFELVWDAAGDVGGYELWQGNNPVARLADTRVVVGVGMGWKVRSCNGAGCSGFSDTVNTSGGPGTVCP